MDKLVHVLRVKIFVFYCIPVFIVAAFSTLEFFWMVSSTKCNALDENRQPEETEKDKLVHVLPSIIFVFFCILGFTGFEKLGRRHFRGKRSFGRVLLICVFLSPSYVSHPEGTLSNAMKSWATLDADQKPPPQDQRLRENPDPVALNRHSAHTCSFAGVDLKSKCWLEKRCRRDERNNCISIVTPSSQKKIFKGGSSNIDPVALNRDSVLTSSLKGAKWKPKGGRNQVGETKPPDIYLRLV